MGRAGRKAIARTGGTLLISMPVYAKINEWPVGLVPTRIVSFVPSITELLFDLGLGERVVGITKFCIHPNIWFRSKRRIGGTKDIKVHEVLALQPDLVIANLEENVAEQVLKIAEVTNVWLTDIKTLDDALDMISDIGLITGQREAAEDMVQLISKGFGALPEIRRNFTVTYLIWQNPVMTVGGDTFIHHLLKRIGLKNLFEQVTRYPTIDTHLLQANPPDILLLSDEPFPFGPKNVAAWKEKLPETIIELVDGSYFSWYGSRLVHAPRYFAECLVKWNQAL